MSATNHRTQVYVDPEVQRTLVVRMTLHWVVFMVVCFVLVGFLQVCFDQPSLSWGELFANTIKKSTLSIVAGIALLPIFVYDIMRTTNRFAGPVTRMRRILREIAEDGKPRELKIRQTDYWNDMADEFNEAIEKLQATTRMENSPRMEESPKPTIANDPVSVG